MLIWLRLIPRQPVYQIAVMVEQLAECTQVVALVVSGNLLEVAKPFAAGLTASFSTINAIKQ